MGKLRVTTGQKAAVCGLILAGVSFTKACDIAGVGYQRVRPYVPDDYRDRTAPLPVPVRKMSGRQLARYRKARRCLPRDIAYAEAMR